MPTFDSSGVPIYYEVHGTGRPIVLVHGFASSFARNWTVPGWVDFLTAQGFQVIGLDVRGHGTSGKPYDPQAHSAEHTASDVLGLLDHLHLAQPDLMGYSMGAGIALYLAMHHGDRFRRVVLGGIGDGALDSAHAPVRPNLIADAMEATDVNAVTDLTARQFRVFAERGGNDLRALVAVMRRPRAHSDPDGVKRVHQPVLVVVGAQDNIAGGAERLASAIPGAQLVIVPDRNHLTVVGDPRYKEAVLKFLLASHSEPEPS